MSSCALTEGKVVSRFDCCQKIPKLLQFESKQEVRVDSNAIRVLQIQLTPVDTLSFRLERA